eukprot:NODE_8388_length_683_cov_49.426786_g7766_i0.p1 GENE.NODE_8388_length_683_cov_49.426786_g7766_i0~~NODE_8388_length_683_cov_49.426786_g7766_i0.p1  ORF type:complete len:190 (+),score=17.54 NODE_8388_length_683_cov_49.426786_g7766_i0:58-570(+)
MILRHGKNLGDELAFVHSYHNHKINYYIHFIFFPILLSSLCLPVYYYFSNFGPVFIVLIYFIMLSPWDILISSIWAIQFYFIMLAFQHYTINYDITTIALITVVVSGSLGYIIGFIGHNVFQKRNPAFDMYEAIITTPFYLWIRLLFSLGYRPNLRNEMLRNTPKWALDK